jgi:flagellar motor switch protein FliN
LAADLVRELSTALQAVSGDAVSATPDPATAARSGAGWSTAISVAGVRQGALSVWIDKAGATAVGRIIIGGEVAPSDQAVTDALREMWSQAATAVSQRPRYAGVKVLVTGATPADAPASAPHAFTLGLGAHTNAQVVVTGSLSAEAVFSQERANLDLVLDIELPLTVRFGRAIMSLQALSDLGPGSVVDMGRSPDDPVELLISDRVFAKGEVVVVGGNYGVRVTELTGSFGPHRTGELAQ